MFHDINSNSLNDFSFDKKKAYELVCNDKKRNADYIDIIAVEKIGNAKIEKMSLSKLKDIIEGE